MTFEINCTACGQRLRIGDEFDGRQVRCPKCSAIMTASLGGQSAEGATPSGDPGTAGPLPMSPSQPEQPGPQAGGYSPPGGQQQGYPPPPSYQAPGYQPAGQWTPGQQGYYYYPPRTTSGKAIAALVLGILGLVTVYFGIIFGPIAIGLANSADRDIDSNRYADGRGMAKAGRICGIISLVIGLVCCCGYGSIILIGMSGP